MRPDDEPQTTPRMYFVGVTTKQSSIMRIFPEWSDILGLDARLVGFDVPLHAPAATYRGIVEQIKNDPLTRGALVTTHNGWIYFLCGWTYVMARIFHFTLSAERFQALSDAAGRISGYSRPASTVPR
jgi:hypothetical protein